MPARKPDSEITLVQRWRRRNPKKVYQYKHNKCKCGATKSLDAKTCWQCYLQTRSRPAGYRNEYQRKYQRDRYHASANPRRLCECGRKKAPASKRCAECWAALPNKAALRKYSSNQHLSTNRIVVVPPRECPTCETPFEPRYWHGQKYLRCPGCGLERKVVVLEGEQKAA